MNLYDDVTVAAAPPALPAAGPTTGYYTDGAVGSMPRTNIHAWHLNAIQGEIVHVIVEAGLTPSRNDNTQLYQAINAMVSALNLEFTPVQQGGGPNQGTNKIRMGWDVAGTGIRVEVDNNDLGQIALKSDLTNAINALIGGAPGALQTLKELADSINDETNYAAAVTQNLALKAPLAAPAFTLDGNGNYPTSPTPPVNDATTKVATMQAVQAALTAIKPVFFGTATAGGRWDPRDGFLEQWGELDQTITQEGVLSITFPRSFDTCLGVLPTTLDPGSQTDDTNIQRGAYTTTTVNFRVQDSAGNNAAATSGIGWRAWGYRAAQP